jgi:hypothetical protein
MASPNHRGIRTNNMALESPTYRRVSLPSIGRTQRAALCRSHRNPRLFGTLSSGLSLRLLWRADLPSDLWQAKFHEFL